MMEILPRHLFDVKGRIYAYAVSLTTSASEIRRLLVTHSWIKDVVSNRNRPGLFESATLHFVFFEIPGSISQKNSLAENHPVVHKDIVHHPQTTMKKPAPPCLASLILLLSAVSASAQLIEAPTAPLTGAYDIGLESGGTPSFAADRFLSGAYEIPQVQKAQSDLSEAAPVFVSQDALTLNPRRGTARKAENVIDFSVLQETSAYRSANRIKVMVSDQQASGIQSGLAHISAAYQKPAQPADSADCSSVSMSVAYQVKMDASRVLEIVESEIAANPNCACEIVKIAIKSSGADESLVGDIAEVAITAAPESMRMISQCAIAAMPDALAAVQAVLAKLDPNSGDATDSSKGSKSGKEVLSAKDDAKATVATDLTPPIEPPNPLDLPPFFPPLPPPPLPPMITDPNP